MGRISAIFKADGDETKSSYSIFEWWFEPHTKGPGAHAHDEELMSHWWSEEPLANQYKL